MIKQAFELFGDRIFCSRTHSINNLVVGHVKIVSEYEALNLRKTACTFIISQLLHCNDLLDQREVGLTNL